MQGLRPRFSSSGDLIADRRFEWALDCEAKGDLAAATDLTGQALEMAPGFAPGWFALGTLREKQGDAAGAIEAFRKARDLDPHDRQGAVLSLMRLKAEQTGEMPPAFVRELFDQYAQAFDKALQGGLQYKGPGLLLSAVERAAAQLGREPRFGAMLDLGCGTGLAGVVFRSCVDQLVGVDLSPGMVAEARRKGLYDRLSDGDMIAFLSAEADSAQLYDLVVAADVFVYVADIVPALRAAGRILQPGGLLAFTVETHGGEGVVLGEKLRYAHGELHVRSALAGHGLRAVSIEAASSRTENGSPVPGLVVVAASTSPRSRI